MSVGLAVLAGLLVPAAQAGAEAATGDLTSAVVAKIGEKTGTRPDLAGTEVNVMRTDGADWAFGAGIAKAAAVEGAYPEGWLFVAHLENKEWTVAFEGEPGFPSLTAAAPASVVPDTAKPDLAALGPAEAKVATGDAKPLAGGDFRTGMRLPWAVGQSWRYTGGPHGASRQSVDLAGGDGRVLAARAGTVFVMCSSQRGWLRVVHDRGYQTDYYHLHNNRTDNGAAVAEGAFLGNIGVDVSCGGSATGPHVHFSLRQNGVNVAIGSHNFGKWQFYAGSAEYQGTALHGSTQVGTGGSMNNFGALGFTQGIVDTNGGGVLNRRSGPGTNFGIVGTVADGATVTIACSADGTSHTGRFSYTTTLWNRLTDGTWISDAYTWTGTGNPVNGRC
ncbi:MAG TPA: peptidoglycan DD-metalloendopeptidase family protein [Actinophytocola sp.]|uniref:peptidoglycan DD-metalloendopeptidase family protein n=1 Tax=Actinophytocola sp. TaxID=1872138 RepID=UPI002DBF787E|nr:peptidoglycan DD-metalloendopeptidase family protein [Actinophytocola sp.]HEU5471699.1 peptidoglycan DD-metalloendopeptidase family protein [Actinophytocola sp.]